MATGVADENLWIEVICRSKRRDMEPTRLYPQKTVAFQWLNQVMAPVSDWTDDIIKLWK